MFYPEGLVDFALEKSFIPKLPFFLLHRCVQKWLFAIYCPHFSFITLVEVGIQNHIFVWMTVSQQYARNFCRWPYYMYACNYFFSSNIENWKNVTSLEIRLNFQLERLLWDGLSTKVINLDCCQWPSFSVKM